MENKEKSGIPKLVTIRDTANSTGVSNRTEGRDINAQFNENRNTPVSVTTIQHLHINDYTYIVPQNAPQTIAGKISRTNQASNSTFIIHKPFAKTFLSAPITISFEKITLYHRSRTFNNRFPDSMIFASVYLLLSLR
jgi:hypothetical protein